MLKRPYPKKRKKEIVEIIVSERKETEMDNKEIFGESLKFRGKEKDYSEMMD